MQKTILLTGATDGIGLETAKTLVADGHHVLLHGRNPKKLEAVKAELSKGPGTVESYQADLSDMDAVVSLANEVKTRHTSLDVLINNAGVFHVSETRTPDGYDVRFVVNTLAPYLLFQHLRPLLGEGSRVVNLSSAAQAPVNFDALNGKARLGDMEAYSQSKLGITMWTRALKDLGPMIVAVNPGSMLATNMVKQAFGVSGNSIQIGADILCRAALSDDFADASGKYFDNDSGRFAPPHNEGTDSVKGQALLAAMDRLLEGKLPT